MVAVALSTASCGNSSNSVAPVVPPVVPPVGTSSGCAGKSDTTKVPLNDLGAGCYFSFQGGLYPGGSDALPAAHLAAGMSAAAQIQPLDVNGNPSASGKYALVSIGMSNATEEFCSDAGTPGSCDAFSFMGQAAADGSVNHSTLVLVDGAALSQAADSWTSASAADYDHIRDTWLRPLGLSEKQVQAAWVKEVNKFPTVSLPDPAADAYLLEQRLAQIARALKVRYPNLRQVFFSSRIYAGYATSILNPEPYAYESGFSVKWAIESQISQMGGPGTADARAGSLRYDDGTAAWMAWGPYLWAAGLHPRSDGLVWAPSDFSPVDGTHPEASARQKVGTMLLAFFKSAPETQCWFLAGRTCR